MLIKMWIGKNFLTTPIIFDLNGWKSRAAVLLSQGATTRLASQIRIDAQEISVIVHLLRPRSLSVKELVCRLDGFDYGLVNPRRQQIGSRSSG